MLHELTDGHVFLYTEGGDEFFVYENPRAKRGQRTFHPHVVRNYFDRELISTGSGGMDYGKLAGNLGYIHLVSFAIADWVYEIDSILDNLRETKGLILDVRNNIGGTTLTIIEIFSRFIQSPFNWPTPTQIFDGQPKQFTPIIPRGPYQYTKPLVVLINGASVSSAEIFAELMKQLPNVTVVGDTTPGDVIGRTPDRIYVLPSGKRIHLPHEVWLSYDGQPMEWNGVSPDIRVVQTEADIKQGRDKQLEYAIGFLKGQF